MKGRWLMMLLAWSLLWNCGLILKNDFTFDLGKGAENIHYSGARSSAYGIKPFPPPQGWTKAIQAVKTNFPDSLPCAIWIVGHLNPPQSCFLEFPNRTDRKFAYVDFAPDDKHESYLSHFDRVGIKVFLQVEPAHGDVVQLIDIVLNQYKHHPCVIGFGVDVEWYKVADKPGWGVRVSDQEAESWEKAVKSHHRNYRLFLKHWDRRWMPKHYRGDLIFVDDSQMLHGFQHMIREFVTYWADYFKPNTVFFQIGYRSDKKWWQKLSNPSLEIGLAVAQNITQPCGFFWVDFTLNDVYPVK